VPIIVVGNITVGGSGKTPLVIWIAKLLTKAGLSPGIVSCGYRGSKNATPHLVSVNSNPHEVGDEPILLAKQANCPVVICRNRVLAAQHLLASTKCNVIISDDGLQHYAMFRDIEIAVIDGARWFGNNFCLPAGPLREPISRLQQADLLVVNGTADQTKTILEKSAYLMQLIPMPIVNLKNPALTKSARELRGIKIIAYAGIGNPQRFFQTLCNLGLEFEARPFPDHYVYSAKDFHHTNELILMTEKDAVKCRDFARENFWYLPVSAKLEPTFNDELLEKFLQKRNIRLTN
jgi:tetraacyldisaccharide 4'-kinase